jgi:choice-of-anchor B domain-containing protein
MSYFRFYKYRKIAGFLMVPAAMIMLGVHLPASAIGPGITPVIPQHDDHGEHPPIPKGTESALCQSGVSSGFACRNIEMQSRVELADIGGGTGSDSWGWKDPQSGRYYALMARSNGTSFIDVTDPVAPLYLGNLPSTSGNRPWRDIKVYADHAFVVADGIDRHGMQVFDLTRLRGVQSPQEFTADALYSDVGPAHNVAINEQTGFAYIVGGEECAGGLHMVDISSPKAPVFAGCFSGDGYSHDVQCVSYSGPDPDHQGAEVCFGSNEDSLTVVDVSNKGQPVMLGKAHYPETAYSHQGWLDKEQGVFFMGDEIDELNFGMNTRTLKFDVSDLDNPVYAGAHSHGTSVIDHNMYVNGDYLYQANYQAGLRILHINRQQNFTLDEVAYFDTVPEADSLQFAGAWSVYPFFDNGTILVSDINNGLFILKASLQEGVAESALLNGRISGAWVAEGLNDQGIMLFVDETDFEPVIFFTWFVYLDGEPFWLSGAAGFEYGEDEVSIPTQRLSGLQFVNPSTDTAVRTDIGTLNIHVHACDELHVDYDFGEMGSRELEFTRLAGVQGRGCASAATIE